MDTQGYRKWWEVKLYQGKNERGEKQSVEVFRNMETGQLHAPENGWNGAPPNGEDPLPIHTPSELYLQNYDKIRWDKDHGNPGHTKAEAGA